MTTEDFEFGEHYERCLVGLALEVPDYFASVGHHINPEMFRVPEVRAIMACAKHIYDERGFIPSKGALIDEVRRTTKTTENFRPIVKLLKQPLDPRDAEMTKARFMEWAKHEQYHLLYSEDAITAWDAGDYSKLDKIVDQAHKMEVMEFDGLWFFESVNSLFETEETEKLTSGFDGLDKHLNHGGPSRKEILVFAAPPNVGKSIILCNCGVQAWKRGFNVLHISMEMGKKQVAQRYTGIFSNIPTSFLSYDKGGAETQEEIEKQRKNIRKAISGERSSRTENNIHIVEFPAESASVDDIRQLIDSLRRRHGFVADVIIIDYMELMKSKRGGGGGDMESKEYLRQRKVMTEARALAQVENALVITATQGNRASVDSDESKGNTNAAQGTKPKLIEMDKLADSFGKSAPIDYLVTINQTEEEYKLGKLRLWISKNRNGPKKQLIPANVNYDTMRVTEDTASGVGRSI